MTPLATIYCNFLKNFYHFWVLLIAGLHVISVIGYNMLNYVFVCLIYCKRNVECHMIPYMALCCVFYLMIMFLWYMAII